MRNTCRRIKCILVNYPVASKFNSIVEIVFFLFNYSGFLYFNEAPTWLMNVKQTMQALLWRDEHRRQWAKCSPPWTCSLYSVVYCIVQVHYSVCGGRWVTHAFSLCFVVAVVVRTNYANGKRWHDINERLEMPLVWALRRCCCVTEWIISVNEERI